MSKQWYLHQNDQQKGPFSWEDLNEQASKGMIEQKDLVWSEGMPEWTTADKVAGLIQPKEAAPPPPPKIQPGPPPPPAAPGLAVPPSTELGGSAPPPPSPGLTPPPPAQGGYAAPPDPTASGMAHGSGSDHMAPAPKKKTSGLKIAAIIGGSVLVLFVIMIVVILAGVRSTLRSSEVYSQSIAGLLSNPQAVALLGEPVEADNAVNGEINVNNGSGNAELSIPVSGSISKGDLQSRGLRTDGQWSLTLLELVMENGERIDLLAGLSQDGQNEQTLGQADLGAGSGSAEDEDLPPRQAGGGAASDVTGMLTFNEPDYGFTMNYPADWSYYLDGSMVSFESPSETPAEELTVLVQILGNSSIGGQYANLDDVYNGLESLYQDLDGELFESERGNDYIGDAMYDYVWTGAIYPYEGVEYLELALVIQRDSEYFYLLMYTIPLDAEEDFIDLVFDEMFESFRFVAF
jgi:hypothetical protein